MRNVPMNIKNVVATIKNPVNNVEIIWFYLFDKFKLNKFLLQVFTKAL